MPKIEKDELEKLSETQLNIDAMCEALASIMERVRAMKEAQFLRPLLLRSTIRDRMENYTAEMSLKAMTTEHLKQRLTWIAAMCAVGIASINEGHLK